MDRDQIDKSADALYQAVIEDARDDEGANTKIYTQERLLELVDVPGMKELLPIIQHLVTQNLFRTAKVKGKLNWSARPRNAAKQISTLDNTEKMIYGVIEDAHTNGVWSRDIRKKTQLVQNAVTKALGKMEKINLIKSVKSVKNPVQRTYMLYHLVPSEDVTGNSFFDAGDLDESFRDELMNLIIFWVRQQSWVEERRRVGIKREPGAAGSNNNSHDAPPHPDAHAAPDGPRKKRKRTEDIEDAVAQPPSRRTFQLTHRAGSHDYPTAESIHEFLTRSDAIKAAKAASLTVQEIQGCVDVLVWDEKLERVPNRNSVEWGYRTVRGVTFNPAGGGASYDEDEEEAGEGGPMGSNGLMQAPCGRCPVLDLCHKDGPINPAECVYLDQWLDEGV